MRQIILIVIAVLGISFTQAQNIFETSENFKTETYKDDFGDDTGKKFAYQDVTGKFSNSVTTRSECAFILIAENNTLRVSIYPYGGTIKETFIESVFSMVTIKDPQGNKHNVEVFVATSGTLFFGEHRYAQLMEVLNSPGDYYMAYAHSDSYSRSSYVFKFKI